MGLLDIFRKKEEVSQKEKKAPLYPQRKENNNTQAILKDIAKKLKDHDRYVRENVAKELSIKQLLEALEKRFQALPIGKSVRNRLTDGQKKILAVLNQDPETYYSYKEIASITRLTHNGVRGLVSEMVKMGFKFEKRMIANERKIQLISSDPIASPNRPIASSD